MISSGQFSGSLIKVHRVRGASVQFLSVHLLPRHRGQDCYAVLARAQLHLHEPAADISATLDEYAALLERTELHLYEGELHELRARLAEREGDALARTAALRRAYAGSRFGLTAQAERLGSPGNGAGVSLI